jgi:hypothetical protein
MPASSKLWMRCAARRLIPRWGIFPAGNAAGWRCAGCCYSSRICCCWTSRPTTSTPRVCNGSIEVIKTAERIVYREKWRLCEERAAEQLARTSSLAWTRLFPESPVIRVVALDGVVIGRVRRNGGRWTATGAGQRGQVADCGTFPAALLALVCEAQNS